MTFRDNYAPDEDGGPQDPVSAFLEDRFDQALGVAADLAVDLRVDIEQKGPFWRYLEACRSEAIQALSTLSAVDASDASVIRSIQMTLHAYQSATGFALKVIDGYAQPESDSAEDAESGVGEPL